MCEGKETPIGQHISNTAEDEKSIPHLNIGIVLDMAYSKFYSWFLLNSRNLLHVFLKREISWGSLIKKWKIGIVPTFTLIRKQKNGEKKIVNSACALWSV